MASFFDPRQLENGGWDQSGFVYGLLALVASCMSEAWQFARRLSHSTPQEIEEDDSRILGIVIGIVFMCAASCFFGVFARLSGRSPIFVIVLAVVLTFVAVAPRTAARMYRRPDGAKWKPPTDSDPA